MAANIFAAWVDGRMAHVIRNAIPERLHQWDIRFLSKRTRLFAASEVLVPLLCKDAPMKDRRGAR